jgi:hypothetical protein
MAGTFAPNAKTSATTRFGNFQVCMGVIDAADGAGEAITIGNMKTITGYTASPKSCATDGSVKFTISTNTITPTSADSGDTYDVVIFGV